MTNALLIDKIYLTETELTELVFTNIENVNAYFDLHVHSDEISPAVLYSYYVDYYLSQVLNGGIAQFAYNSRWNSGMLHYVEFGLAEMGATQHLELLEEIADVIMGQIGIDNFINFTQQNLLNKNKIHDKLNRLTVRTSSVIYTLFKIKLQPLIRSKGLSFASNIIFFS